jgi:hypothetical protein
VQLNVAMAILEAAALLYLNELLPNTARRAMGVVMRLAPKAAAVLAALAVQPHARLPDRQMLQAGSMANAHVAVGGELLWYSALYALPASLHVPVVLVEWLLLAYNDAGISHVDSAVTAGSALLQAGLVVATTTPITIAAQHIWAKARMFECQLQRGPSSTVDVQLQCTTSEGISRKVTDLAISEVQSPACDTAASTEPDASADVPTGVGHPSAAAPAAPEAAASTASPGAAAAAAVRSGSLADAVQETLQMAASHALTARDAAREAQQRQQALQHVTQVLGADIAALVAASSAQEGPQALPHAPMTYSGRCKVAPVSIVVRQRGYMSQVGSSNGAALECVATAMLDSLEASAGMVASSTGLPWHVHATCITGAPLSKETAPAAYVGSAAAKVQHAHLLLYMNELLAQGAHRAVPLS